MSAAWIWTALAGAPSQPWPLSAWLSEGAAPQGAAPRVGRPEGASRRAVPPTTSECASHSPPTPPNPPPPTHGRSVSAGLALLSCMVLSLAALVLARRRRRVYARCREALVLGLRPGAAGARRAGSRAPHARARQRGGGGAWGVVRPPGIAQMPRTPVRPTLVCRAGAGRAGTYDGHLRYNTAARSALPGRPAAVPPCNLHASWCACGGRRQLCNCSGRKLRLRLAPTPRRGPAAPGRPRPRLMPARAAL